MYRPPLRPDRVYALCVHRALGLFRFRAESPKLAAVLRWSDLLAGPVQLQRSQGTGRWAVLFVGLSGFRDSGFRFLGFGMQGLGVNVACNAQVKAYVRNNPLGATARL